MSELERLRELLLAPERGELQQHQAAIERLQQAQARAQAQQQAVHRVLASTGRVLTALFPQNESETYAALGQSPSARAVGKAYR